MDRLCDFNLSLEVLEGCGYNCSDCAVDKTFEPQGSVHPDAEQLLGMVSQLKDMGFRPFEFTLGPTDIASSSNGLALLQSPLVKGLAEHFGSMVISLSLLSDRGLKELAEAIDAVMGGKRLRVITPVTVKNTKNVKYIQKLQERLALLKGYLKETDLYASYLTINMFKDNVEQFDADYHRTAMGISLGPRTTVEYSFAHSRGGFENLLRQEQFKRDLYKFTQIIADNDEGFSGQLLHDPFDGIELGYRDGKLYYIPVVMEKFPIFDQFFEIPKPWSAETVIGFKEEQYHTNLVTFTSHPTCADCCHVSTCTHGDLHTTMRYLKIDHCPLGLKNRTDLIRTFGKELAYCGQALEQLPVEQRGRHHDS